MIGFIKGVLDSISTDSIVIDNNGIGFKIYVPASVIGQLPPSGSEIKIYTYTYVKEDMLALYGFLSGDDLEFFKLLITVNGIGPKGALSILSVMDVDSLRFAILSGDAATISKAPGIGKKTAEKLILDLKDKCDPEDFLSSGKTAEDDVSTGSSVTSNESKDAIEALVALGYSSTDAMRAVRSVSGSENMDVESILKSALRGL